MDKIVQTVRNSFNTNVTHTLKWRRDQLNALMRLIDENEKELCDALKKDMNKHPHETAVMVSNGY
jgi:aldehyde dehydrogenase (NAD+)